MNANDIAVLTDNLVRTYKVLSTGFYDPGIYFETAGGRFLYEVFMRSITKKVVIFALNGVNINVRRGEFVCILGPNGSGKTTLIKILATLIPPMSGKAEVMGYDVVKDKDEVVKLVTYIPSILGASAWARPRLTVRRNIVLACRLFGIPKDEGLEAAKKLGLDEYLDRPFGSLSTGLQARVGLLIGVLRRTPVYLLDEPLMGISPEAARLLRSYFLKINREFGITFLYATHRPLEAQELATRVIILHRGKVVADGSPDDLIRKANVEEAIELEMYKAYFNIEEVLRRYEPNYVHVEHLEPEAGAFKVIVGIRCCDDVLPRLIEELVSRGAKIRRLRVRRASLEDAYLYYVGGGSG